MPPTTTNSATGLFRKNTLPSTSTTNAAMPMPSDADLVSFKCLRMWALFSQKSPWIPGKPQSLGNCVLTRNSARPHLKPTMTPSEMKHTMAPALTSRATNAIPATSRAVPDASAPRRAASPSASPPSVDPTSSEMADVRAIAVCFELQKSQNASPENKQAYRPA